MGLVQFLGLGIFILGSLGFLIAAFRTSILWGLGCFFISPISLIYLVVHWNSAKGPFGLQIVGLGIFLMSSYFKNNV